MRAWLCRSWGEPEGLVLDDVPSPACSPDSVKIRAHAWGVNFADLVLIAGRYQARPAFPFSPGMEVAGIVEQVGRNVDRFENGDRVAAYVEFGGYADLVVAPASSVMRVPKDVPIADAAAFPLPFATAALALRRGNVKPSERVLIAGAAGAVGHACIQLSRLQGAYVYAAVSNEEKAIRARASGANEVLFSISSSLRGDIERAAPGGVDVVFDPVGGDFFENAGGTLAFGGRYVTLGFASGTIPTAQLNQILVRHVSVIGSSLGLTCHKAPDLVQSLWPSLEDQFAERTITPNVSAKMPFAELPVALRKLADRSVAGRIVLS